MRSSLYLACLWGLASCADPAPQIRYGETTKAALVSEKGQPQSTERPQGREVELLVYPDNQKYQISRDVVVAGFRDPSSEERSLLYWRHLWKDCATSFTDLAAPEGHLRPEKELKCPTSGLSVIYDPNIDQVTRVVEHAQK